MESILFYNYLKHQQKSKESFMKIILKIPTMAIILFALLVVSAVGGIVFFLIKPLQQYSWFFMLIELLFPIILYIYDEMYQKKTSFESFHLYIENCKQTYEWLRSFSITKKTSIHELNQRILSWINQLEAKSKEKRERIDKWMQVLIIPIILLLFSFLINSQMGINTIFESIFWLFIILASIYALISAIRILSNILNKRKLNQLYYFSNALQGVLDTQFDDGLLTSAKNMEKI